jgi:CRP/FNR family transcriptional regulator
MALFEGVVGHTEPRPKSSHLFRMGDPLEALFVIRSGTIKSYHLTREGTEQVTGFWLPGEIVGFDAMATGVHPSSALSLERTSVCTIPFNAFEELAGQIPGLTHRFTRMVGRYIVAEQDLLLLRGRDTADERLALFLLNFSNRLQQRGYSGTEFNLSMPRRDIAKYLGLAVETVSRTLTRFRLSGLIQVERRKFVLRDINRLREIGQA